MISTSPLATVHVHFSESLTLGFSFDEHYPSFSKLRVFVVLLTKDQKSFDVGSLVEDLQAIAKAHEGVVIYDLICFADLWVKRRHEETVKAQELQSAVTKTIIEERHLGVNGTPVTREGFQKWLEQFKAQRIARSASTDITGKSLITTSRQGTIPAQTCAC